MILPVEVIADPTPKGGANTDRGQVPVLNATSPPRQNDAGEPVPGVTGRAVLRVDREKPMISLPSGTKLWFVAGVTDMRKSFNGLGELVQHALDANPLSGHLFIFCGFKGDTVKILWAVNNG